MADRGGLGLFPVPLHRCLDCQVFSGGRPVDTAQESLVDAGFPAVADGPQTHDTGAAAVWSTVFPRGSSRFPIAPGVVPPGTNADVVHPPLWATTDAV